MDDLPKDPKIAGRPKDYANLGVATMNLIRMFLVLIVMTFPLAASAQRWTAEEQEILDFATSCWMSWEDAVNEKDHEIWLKSCLLTTDWAAWWTNEGALWTIEAEKRNFKNWVQVINHFHFENLQPVEIRVYGDTALMWYYATSTVDDSAGIRTRYEDKRFEVFRKVDGHWRWTAGMISAREASNFVDN